MTIRMTSTENKQRKLHPFCRECGWRKGGLDSWSGHACKCGFYAEPLPDVADILPLKKPENKRA